MNYQLENITKSDLHPNKLKRLHAFGLTPYRIPIRLKGLSSEGEQWRCHTNVVSMVKRYGGKRLIGQKVIVHEGGVVELNGHSVWITPENKTVCITKRNHTPEELSKGYFIFIPRMVDETPISLDNQTIHYDCLFNHKRVFMLHPFASEGSAELDAMPLKGFRKWKDKLFHYSLRKMQENSTFLLDRVQ